MRVGTIETIRRLLSRPHPDDLRRGLAKVREVARDAPPREADALIEMVAALFYLDPLDRPDLAPVLEDAIATAAGFGPRFVPVLLAHLDTGDIKAQIAVGHALGRMGAAVVEPLVAAYRATDDPDRRSVVLYALGKVHAPQVVPACAIAVDGASSPDREVRDTATRTLGRLATAIPAGGIPEPGRGAMLAVLRRNLADPSAAVRAKAVRSLGKLAAAGHLTGEEVGEVAAGCRRIAGRDREFDWDRGFAVRREAEEALRRMEESGVLAKAPEAVVAGG